MTNEERYKVEKSGVDIKQKGGGSLWSKVFLIAAAVVFVVALGVAAVFIMDDKGVDEDRIVRVIDYGTVLSGVSIGGVDVSGMTGLEASEATKDISEQLLASAKFVLDVDGEVTEYDASSFELYTNYEEMFAAAMRYGHVGTFDERKAAKEAAGSNGAPFDIEMFADKGKVVAVIADLKLAMDRPSSDAGYTFMPWGFFEDGTAYEPDMEEMVTILSKKDEFVYPEGLVTIADEDMPSDLRYEYYQDDWDWEEHYEEQYKPKDANIARFSYSGESKGVVVDSAATVELVMAAVQNDDFSKIAVPAEIIHSEATLESMLNSTQLITSWTSSYHDHYSRNRTFNVGKLSYIISGVVIMPGETWSINEEAGERTRANGWKEAAGISSGAFTQQYGGGVCQVSSTLFNAALRAGLDHEEDIDHANHTIISDYIPIGLDATISSKGPDLKLTNPYDTPLYIVSYLNGVEENITIEVYGSPIIHEVYGPIIYDFSSRRTGTGEAPEYTYIYDTPVAPDGEVIPEGGSYRYIKSRGKTTARAYMHILDLLGNELIEKEHMFTATYKAYTGVYYVNGPAPTPSPTPEPSPTTT